MLLKNWHIHIIAKAQLPLIDKEYNTTLNICRYLGVHSLNVSVGNPKTNQELTVIQTYTGRKITLLKVCPRLAIKKDAL